MSGRSTPDPHGRPVRVMRGRSDRSVRLWEDDRVHHPHGRRTGSPAVHRERLATVLTPAGSDWSTTDGWGDLRLRRGDTEISFAGDMVGWLVSFDGPISDAKANRIIEIIASQIETEVGESIEFVQVGWQE